MEHGNSGIQSGWGCSSGIRAVLEKGAYLGRETARVSSKLNTPAVEKPLPLDIPSRQRVLQREVV